MNNSLSVTDRIASRRVLIIFSVAITHLMMAATEVSAQERLVQNDRELREALRSLTSGMTLKIAPGEYSGGNTVQGISGLTVEAQDPNRPPHFRGGNAAWQFSRCDGLTLRYLRISGQQRNGINIDDGGELDRPVADVTLEHIEISDIGPRGNHDAIKGSGLRRFKMRNCILNGWAGQGIDLVGCHMGLISECELTGKAGFSASAGIQLKGGSSEITVEKCRFRNAGERPVNVGGSTGLAYFRPQGAKYEAQAITVTNNIIEGSLSAAAFVGVDGAEFSGNTILFPEKWIFRVLQETREPGFVTCRNVVIRDNRIIFRRSQVQTEVNIGSNTSPESFRFENNRWFAEDRPQSSRPSLPSEETDGVYGSDPR